MLIAQCVRQSPPASQIRVVSYLVPWLFSLFWAQCAHAQSNPFYHPFYPDVTHVRKDTRPSPALPYCKQQKAGRGLGTRLHPPHVHFMWQVFPDLPSFPLLLHFHVRLRMHKKQSRSGNEAIGSVSIYLSYPFYNYNYKCIWKFVFS